MVFDCMALVFKWVFILCLHGFGFSICTVICLEEEEEKKKKTIATFYKCGYSQFKINKKIYITMFLKHGFRSPIAVTTTAKIRSIDFWTYSHDA